MPPDRVLDLGCGVGHSYHLLAPRETVGVDIDAGALEGQERRTVVADMRELPFADGEFDSVLSVHSLEHVPIRSASLAEVARVLDRRRHRGVRDPEPAHLRPPRRDHRSVPLPSSSTRASSRSSAARLRRGPVAGLFGSPRYMEIFDEERETLDRLLASTRSGSGGWSR